MCLTDYIKVYDDVLDKDICEYFSLLFQMSPSNEKVKNKVINFSQLNINKHFKESLPPLIRGTREALSRYKEDVKETSHFPKNTLSLEEFRVKCYNAGTGEQFDTHVDVGDHNSAKRFLSFLFYLNNDFTGGQTRFFDDYYITPKMGSVLVFPPTWQYPHAGLPVDTGRKFIISTYLHYT